MFQLDVLGQRASNEPRFFHEPLHCLKKDNLHGRTKTFCENASKNSTKLFINVVLGAQFMKDRLKLFFVNHFYEDLHKLLFPCFKITRTSAILIRNLFKLDCESVIIEHQNYIRQFPQNSCPSSLPSAFTDKKSDAANSPAEHAQY